MMLRESELTRLDCTENTENMSVLSYGDFRKDINHLEPTELSAKRKLRNNLKFDDPIHDSCEQQQPVKRRKVRFGQSTAMEHDTYALSIEERQSLWYSRKDLSMMKRSAKEFCAGLDLEVELFQAYSSTKSSPDEAVDQERIAAKASFLSGSVAFEKQRGLERWSSSNHMLSRCVAIVSVRAEVFLEQSIQSMKGQHDPERLASVCHPVTSQSVQYARVLGLADASLRESIRTS